MKFNTSYFGGICFKTCCFILLFLCFSCTEDNQELPVCFNLSLNEVKSNSASLFITHNGSNRDTYVGFVLEGTVSDIYDEINRYISSFSDTDKIKDLIKNQKKKLVDITGLFSESKYTYIVFGINEDMSLYGTPCSIEFTTSENSLILNEQDTWNIQYCGTDIYDNGYYSKTLVEVPKDVEDRFFICVYDSATIARFRTEKDFIVYATETFCSKENVSEDEDFWINSSSVYTKSMYYYKYLYEGKYISYAIGVNADGTPTGDYVKTSPYYVEEYPSLESYSNILGSWKMYSVSGNSYDVFFTKDKVNRSFIMTGWGNHSYTIKVGFNQNKSSLYINSQVSEENAYFVLDGEESFGMLKLSGWYYNILGELMPTTSDLTLASGTLDTEGDYIFEAGFSVTFANGSKATETGMTYILYFDDSSYAILALSKMEFPIIMTKSK